MTFRHVPATEVDVVHVSIETVTPNSPAAQADLQKGDRLIAIGGWCHNVRICATKPKVEEQCKKNELIFNFKGYVQFLFV